MFLKLVERMSRVRRADIIAQIQDHFDLLKKKCVTSLFPFFNLCYFIILMTGVSMEYMSKCLAAIVCKQCHRLKSNYFLFAVGWICLDEIILFLSPWAASLTPPFLNRHFMSETSRLSYHKHFTLIFCAKAFNWSLHLPPPAQDLCVVFSISWPSVYTSMESGVSEWNQVYRWGDELC